MGFVAALKTCISHLIPITINGNSTQVTQATTLESPSSCSHDCSSHPPANPSSFKTDLQCNCFSSPPRPSFSQSLSAFAELPQTLLPPRRPSCFRPCPYAVFSTKKLERFSQDINMIRSFSCMKSFSGFPHTWNELRTLLAASNLVPAARPTSPPPTSPSLRLLHPFMHPRQTMLCPDT